jgi:hypothetical protein
MAKEFRARQFDDFEILENQQMVGTVRVKPSGILWSPRGSHSWFRIGIEEFGEYAQKHGTKQDK